MRHQNFGTILSLAFFLVCASLETESAAQSAVQLRLNDHTLAAPNVPTIRKTSFQESDFESAKRIRDERTSPRSDSPFPRLESPGKTGRPTNQQQSTEPTQQLESDAPIEPPKFNLDASSGIDTSSNQTRPKKDSTPNSGLQNDAQSYQLPMVADVNAPISLAPLAMAQQSDPSGLLVNQRLAHSNHVFRTQDMTYEVLSGNYSSFKTRTWQAHDFYHRPLYFEERNVERHGNRRPFENLASTIHFFGTIPKLPYRIGERPLNQKTFTHGQVRPGDYTQFQIHQGSPSRRGMAFQTLATLGIILP